MTNGLTEILTKSDFENDDLFKQTIYYIYICTNYTFFLNIWFNEKLFLITSYLAILP